MLSSGRGGLRWRERGRHADGSRGFAPSGSRCSSVCPKPDIAAAVTLSGGTPRLERHVGPVAGDVFKIGSGHTGDLAIMPGGYGDEPG